MLTELCDIPIFPIGIQQSTRVVYLGADFKIILA